MKDNLKAFLKTNGAYGAFVSNIRMKCGEERLSMVVKSLSEEKGWACIAGAFAWSNTPEGSDYWLDLANQFNSIDK